MTDTEPLDLNAIEARANAASDGPWAREPYVWKLAGHPDTAWVGIDADEGEIARVRLDGSGGDWSPEADAEFIAHAREDVPALIAEVRRLREAMIEAHESIAGEYECGAGEGILADALGIKS